jgi:hypothetical protein
MTRFFSNHISGKETKVQTADAESKNRRKHVRQMGNSPSRSAGYGVALRSFFWPFQKFKSGKNS